MYDKFIEFYKFLIILTLIFYLLVIKFIDNFFEVITKSQNYWNLLEVDLIEEVKRCPRACISLIKSLKIFKLKIIIFYTQ